MKRPPEEHYVRATVEVGPNTTIEPAVEWRPGDDWRLVHLELEQAARIDGGPSIIGHYPAVSDACGLAAPVSEYDPMDSAKNVASVIRRRFPDRAYFVETWGGGYRGFAQVFQPFGVPRNRPDETTLVLRDLLGAIRASGELPTSGQLLIMLSRLAS